MNLRDATDRAAVDLFLRNLYFTFPPRDVVGIPGNVIGFPQPHQKEEESALLMHELEHINSLMFPVGSFFTALALHAHDLRNDMTARFSKLQKDRLALAESEEVPVLQALDVGLHASLMAEFARLVLTTVELMMPLLEGLAMISEMELEQRDSSWTWMLAVGLEYNYYEHQLALTDSSRWKLLEQDEDRADVVERLFTALETQLKVSRARRLQGELLDRIFFSKPDDKRAVAVSPYFYGYLYLNRLYQEWKRHLPELNFERFASLASKLICSVIPLTVLPLYSTKDHGKEAISLQLPSLFKSLLKDFISLTGEQIQQLEGRGELVWHVSDQFIPWEYHAGSATEGGDAAARENRVLAEIIWSIYDRRDVSDPKLAETIEYVEKVERAKFLVRTAFRNVFIVGIDEEAGDAAMIVDPTRIKENQEQRIVDVDGTTFFQFRNAAELQQFLEIVEKPDSRLPRMRLGEAPYNLSWNEKAARAQLQTFCYFWPHGVPYDEQGTTSLTGPPVSTVRVLLCKEKDQPASEYKAFIYGPEIRDLPALLRLRDYMNRNMLSNISRVLEPDFKDSRMILKEVGSVHAVVKDVTREMLKRYSPGGFSNIQSKCRSIYSTLLFPAGGVSSEPAISKEKFYVLAESLERVDITTVRRWLKGLVMQSSRAYDLTGKDKDKEAELSSLERIRSCALAKLGIPLVNYLDNPPRIVLDLIPPNPSP